MRTVMCFQDMFAEVTGVRVRFLESIQKLSRIYSALTNHFGTEAVAYGEATIELSSSDLNGTSRLESI